MLQRIKRFFGLGNQSHPQTEQPYPYPQSNIHVPPPGFPYYLPPHNQAIWPYTAYSAPPGAQYNGGGYPPYPGPGEQLLPKNVHPVFQPPLFPTVYHPPPYPPPQMYPAPLIATRETTGQHFGSIPVIPPPVPIQTIKEESLSYQWPDGNVKLQCTTGQEPFGWDDQGWMWRSSGPRKQGLPSGAFKVDKRLCLGVFHCACLTDDGEPRRVYRPKKDKTPREKQHSETCHICHSTLTYVSCDASLTYYMYLDDNGTQRSVRQHHGRHEHPRPPIKTLPAADRAALDRQVRENPQLTAQQLRTGAGPTQVPLGAINPILSGSRKARTEVENSKARQGIIQPAATRNSGFQLLEALASLQESFETPWIVKSNLMDGGFIVMQTPFMREVLLQDQIRSWHEEVLVAESGRHGVVTDGCHDFFKQGVLLISLVFSQVMLRWSPVLYTWIGKLDTAHHKAHFDQLVYVIAEMCTRGLGYVFDERLYSTVLDFSSAQRNGFIEAFVDFMCARIPGWNTLSEQSRTAEAASLRARAEALIQGCIVHWKRSLHKIKQTISNQYLYRFEQLVGILESEGTTPAEFIQAVETILVEFPEVRPWLSWWILPGNGNMIFPAMRKMPADLQAKLPRSTNAAESGHWLLYRGVGFGFDLWEGTKRLYRFQREIEMLYAAIIAGHVDARFQGSRPVPKSRIKWHENDGRAPDTRERLAAVQKLEAEFAVRNATLSDEERWIACNSAPALPRAPLPPPPTSAPPTTLMRRSYVWDSNSCFIDAPLEAYFRAFVAMGPAVRGEFLRRIRSDARDTGLRTVVEHLWLRGLLSGAIEPPSNNTSKKSKSKAGSAGVKSAMQLLQDSLLAGQLNVKQLIANKWDRGEFVSGMASCARTWLNQMVNTDTTREIKKNNHSTHRPHGEVSTEIGIHHGDFLIAQGYIDPDYNRPLLNDYLIHAIPRERFGTSRTITYRPLHTGPPISCSHSSCNDSDAHITSISTEWPLLLRMDPIWRTRDVETDPDLPQISCPLTIKLGSDVEYKLVSRVLFYGDVDPSSIGHYVTKTELKNSTYLYNDLQHGGSLVELGPLYLLEEYDRDTSYVLYLRTSKAFKTSRKVAEIQADFAKIPHRSKEPIEIHDSEDELDRMLLDTLTSPDKKPRPAPTSTSLSPPPGCGMQEPDGDNNPDEVQCEKCRLWAHIECLPAENWEDPEVHFICARCKRDYSVDMYVCFLGII
ncbi:hypothetical protein DFH07DRAFT_939194 [Mycena maculata]|uniref:GCM domain-containing protein n=1 Tax=Mycena maculata TaxID=230809 RepID=A0AAD7NK99_9AGAR|nr:hypothetical protein DFH07DRAFT_939194 [Mycena maculata]